jgi:hypothetical protein
LSLDREARNLAKPDGLTRRVKGGMTACAIASTGWTELGPASTFDFSRGDGPRLLRSS